MQMFSGLRSYQKETVLGLEYSLLETPGNTFTVMYPRQAGKNEVSAAVVTGQLIAHADCGGSIVVCAPTLYPQASLSFERTARRLKRLAAAEKVDVEFAANVMRCGDATATFLSASPAASVAGHTASLLLIGDEAQDIDAGWFDRQFRPMTSSTGASTILFGTPWQGDSLLERAVAANRIRDDGEYARDPRWHLPWHHQYSWQEVARFNPPYGRFIEQERARLGSQHPIFLSQYELVAAAAERRLLTAEQLWSLEGAFEPLDAPLPGERYSAGLDFGGDRPGGDASVLTLARIGTGCVELVAVYTWSGEPYDLVTAEVAAIARRWRLESLVCDATGMGGPLSATLRRELGRIVQPLVFSRPEKSALGFALQAAAGTGSLAIAPPRTPGLQSLWDELRACRAEPVGRGELTWGAPSGAHDDCVASLVLCLKVAESAGGPRRAVGRVRGSAVGVAGFGPR